MTKFEKELQHLINRYSLENGSNTPDFILANYLVNCLKNYNNTVRATKDWHKDGVAFKEYKLEEK